MKPTKEESAVNVTPIRSIQLPLEEEQLLREELVGTGRSDSSLITEALRLRRAILEALGIQAAGTQPGTIASFAAEAIKVGQRTLRRSKVRKGQKPKE